MENIELNEIRFNMLSEEITTNFFNQITLFEYISIASATIDPTLTVKCKKLKIKDLGIKGILNNEQSEF